MRKARIGVFGAGRGMDMIRQILGRDDARNCAKAWIAEMTEKYNTK